MRCIVLALLLSVAPSLWAIEAKVAPGSHVNLRADKTEGARVVRVLPPAAPIEVLETEGSLAHVRTQTGETGWLPLRLLVVAPAPLPASPQSAPHPAPAEPLSPGEPSTPKAAPQEAKRAFPQVWVAGGLGFLLGALVGIGVHEAYYRKRLNGLRI
ncbi:SH3 domain-containing protein [Thiobacter aerophilum]|uniref:SH3 domain-containing protein n=1 Tax=Thiobacter aerophilum TaxID=3121275 RepID=A0ABV0EEB1_9BURK